MHALCVSGAVNTQGFVWKIFITFLIITKIIHSVIHEIQLDVALFSAFSALSDRHFSAQQGRQNGPCQLPDVHFTHSITCSLQDS